jgi:hypothetical protein
MHLISPIAAGVPDAADGLVFVRARGASTLATCYSSFEGDVLSQPATGIVLDSNGSKIVYVNSLVDVEVQDSTGAAVRQFVAGAAAPNVEVQSLAFTGADYDTGAAAAGNPTTVQDVFDDVLTSFGTTDWNVLLGGSSVTVQAALSSMYGIFYNVKGTSYGATGDGVADDTTPVQNAITAAGTAGGGIVFFPKGSYRITAKLTVPVGVSLWGCGGTVSVIKMDHATADTLEYGTGTGYSPQEIRSLGITAAQANTGIAISLPATFTRNVLIAGCLINWDGTNAYYRGTSLIKVNATTHTLAIVDSLVTVHTSLFGVLGLNTNPIIVTGTSFVTVSTTWAGMFLGGCSNLIASGCTFDMSAVTSGAHQAWAPATTIVKVSFVGNIFKAGTGSLGLNVLLSIDSASTFLTESGNVFSGFTAGNEVCGAFLVSSAALPKIKISNRDTSVELLTTQAAAYTVNPHLYGQTTVAQTAAGATPAINATVGVPPEGSIWTISIYNTSGGLSTYSFGTSFMATTPTLAIPNGKHGIYSFRSIRDAVGGMLVPMGAQVIQG